MNDDNTIRFQFEIWPQKVRFWYYVNHSPVRITLHDGETIRHHMSEPTDEGYHYEGWDMTYSAEDQCVYLNGASGGRDCDGPIDHYFELACPIKDLAANDYIIPAPDYVKSYDGEILSFPKWQKLKTWQRDYFAEQMGY